MTNDVIIELKGLTKRYGYSDTESYALHDFDLTVRRGEFIMIMGPSGCGKTTLLNMLGLLDKPSEGSYMLNGQPVERMSPSKKADIRATKLGVIFQDFNLVQSMSVLDNVTLPLIYSGCSKWRAEKQADEVLEKFHLKDKEYYMPSQLSGGQQQRVAIVRSLVTRPEIILADEPTGNLDSRSSHIVMEELKDIHNDGNTIIMVTHNPALTAYATRVINMLDGQIDTDVKTVADRDLPTPVSVHFRKSTKKNSVLAGVIGGVKAEDVKKSEEKIKEKPVEEKKSTEKPKKKKKNTKSSKKKKGGKK